MGIEYSTEIKPLTHLTVTLHRKDVRVSINDVTPETTLNQYLREHSFLTGTKAMCLEGGCGSCMVAVTRKHPVTKRKQTTAVNSCLVSILSCHGWEVHTVEGIGNKLTGYHPIQQQLAKFNGTQCGFCSPGMVMSMYALSEAKEDLTMADVENSFGGNICRCTGYRPILSAFKAMASDADPELLGEVVPDIEDVVKLCNKTKAPCHITCNEPCEQRAYQTMPFYFELGNKDVWYKVYKFDDVLKVVKENENYNYMLVGGHTARGVYRITQPIERYIDITCVQELVSNTLSDALQLGANIPMFEAIELFQKVSKENANFSYLQQVAVHMNLIANPSIRNIGTLAGNLILKHQHPEFPSDVFLLLETVGANLTVVNVHDGQEKVLSPAEFLGYNMKLKLIKYITFPSLGNDYIFQSYKIMRRAENTHAIVNAGFLVKVDVSKHVQSARIVYGNITPEFVHATEAETYLKGKPLFDNESMQGVFDILYKSLNPQTIPTEPSAEYRKQLAIALYYKFILGKAPQETITARNKSGGRNITLERPISSGLQDYQTNKSMYPITQPIPKIESLAQTSGEAEYIPDRPPAPGQLYGSFVVAKNIPLSTIDKVDTSEVLKISGVVAYIDKNDVPGKNTFTPNESTYKTVEEELFCSGKVLYFNQPIGVILATSQELAHRAADLVKVTYKGSTEKPYFTAREILKDKQKSRIKNEAIVPATKQGTDKSLDIKGTFDIGGQYHFHIETQVCSVELVEDVYNMYPSTQWMDLCHIAAAKALNIPESKINIEVRRCGGSFGGKLSRATLLSTACIVAAHKVKRPVRMWMQMEKNMDIIGKRYPIAADYEAAINASGEIQSLKNAVYSNYGCYSNEPTYLLITDAFKSGYNTETWYLNLNHCTTNMTPNTWFRGPGSVEGSSMIETIMEHLSIESGIDPFDLRYNNIKQQELKDLMTEMKKWSDYTSRQKAVNEFNEANRWIKKGLTVVPMRFHFGIAGSFNCMISIYNGDGSVAVSHGGIEMGQGINTKVAQTVAYTLGIPINLVTVKPSNNFAGGNCFGTGGSITTESICCAIIKVCEKLNKILAPYKKRMKKYIWSDIIEAAFWKGEDLTAVGECHSSTEMKEYDIFGVGVAEVQVDLLTGNQQILRVDILEDVGNSMNPNLDIGQIEGAIVMGIGNWMLEELVYNETGKLLNNRTWNYTPPGPKDIPIDFRVRLEKNKPNPAGIFHTKAVTEPPLLLAYSVPMAVRRALASAREDSSKNVQKWVNLDGCTSSEFIFMNSLNDYKQYKL